MYYYLKNDDVIQTGDEWIINSNRFWGLCTGSVGCTVEEWDILAKCAPGWKVRRLIRKTKLGNEL